MKRLIAVFSTFCVILGLFFSFRAYSSPDKNIIGDDMKYSYWFILHRASNREDFYLGVPGNKNLSKLIRSFSVKVGIPNSRPTPLPQLLNRDYWLIISKKVADDPETAPYFLTLDIPYSEELPYGPVPYLECEGPLSSGGKQCNWELQGEFGLHGVAGDEKKLSQKDSGSSGCVRHADSDISYLYAILDPEKENIRYYIEDN